MKEEQSENQGMKLLLIEDDFDVAESIIDFMESRECATDFAMSGEQALLLLKNNCYDAIILDINLRGMNGFEVCSKIRSSLHLKIPVLMLTARVVLSDKLNGFKCGADDYLTKPFELEELLVRLQAVSRRHRQCVADVFKVADLTLDPDKGIVERAGQSIRLSYVCFRILLRLMEKSPGFVSKEELEYDIWKDQPPMSNALKSHFCMLRTLVDKPFEKQLLQTIRGRGYKIDDSERHVN
ncbi:MAG: response regulator transcription factor [Deferribacterales bacterium]